MTKYEIHASVYAGYWDSVCIDGDYELGLSFTICETNDLEEAKRRFSAVTTTDTALCGNGMNGKTMGLYLHYKHPDYHGIFLDFFLDSEDNDYNDEVYERLYVNESAKED